MQVFSSYLNLKVVKTKVPRQYGFNQQFLGQKVVNYITLFADVPTLDFIDIKVFIHGLFY